MSVFAGAVTYGALFIGFVLKRRGDPKTIRNLSSGAKARFVLRLNVAAEAATS